MRYAIIAARLDERKKCGRIEMLDGAAARTVIVTRRALLSIASPPRATENRLLQHLEAFCDIIRTQNIEPDGTGMIFINANHVRNWRGLRAMDDPAGSASIHTPNAAGLPFPNRPAL
jgi:hypothetical protein